MRWSADGWTSDSGVRIRDTGDAARFPLSPGSRILNALNRCAAGLGLVLSLFALLLAAAPAAAQEAAWTPAPALEARVRAAVAEWWGVDPAAVRLEWGTVREGQEPAADTPFRLVGSGAGGAWVVAFERDGQRAPVQLRLRAGVEVERLVAAHDLERNVTLVDSDIARVTAVHWGAPPRDAGDAVAPGWVTRRRITRDTPLTPAVVSPPAMIEAGDMVRAVWRGGSIEVVIRSRALASAALGETVTVRTEDGRRLEGIATGPAEVQLNARSGGRS